MSFGRIENNSYNAYPAHSAIASNSAVQGRLIEGASKMEDDAPYGQGLPVDSFKPSDEHLSSVGDGLRPFSGGKSNFVEGGSGARPAGGEWAVQGGSGARPAGGQWALQGGSGARPAGGHWAAPAGGISGGSHGLHGGSGTRPSGGHYATPVSGIHGGTGARPAGGHKAHHVEG